MTDSRSKGMATPFLLAVLLIASALGGAFYYYRDGGVDVRNPPGGDDYPDAPAQVTPTGSASSSPVPPASGSFVPDGRVLAGGAAPLVDFTKADYDKAVTEGRLIVLYFYANWCPVCLEEFPKAESAFDTFTDVRVVGFRVNYNDNETDQYEIALARQFGVAYQHTKVILKDGQQVLKNGESWDKERYVNEVSAALQ